MKKILSLIYPFFIVSMANAQIPLETCNGGWVPVGQCGSYTQSGGGRMYAGAIAIHPETLKWASISGANGSRAAKRSVLDSCGSGCKLKHIAPAVCTAVAYSISTKDYYFGSGYGLGSNFEPRKQRAEKNAMETCEKKHEGDCQLLVTATCGKDL